MPAQDWTHFINGNFVEATGEWLEEFDPRTGNVSFRIARGDAATVDHAVTNAAAALPAWRALKPLARGRARPSPSARIICLTPSANHSAWWASFCRGTAR
jgi:acyl-CoA reductase-like NAD-dependent aldehyde dehydrogenase